MKKFRVVEAERGMGETSASLRFVYCDDVEAAILSITEMDSIQDVEKYYIARIGLDWAYLESEDGEVITTIVGV